MSPWLLAVVLLSLLAAQPARASVPEGFADTLVADGFQSPTGFRATPGGRLLVFEKRGVVWLYDDLVFSTPVIDLSDEVGNFGDRGLLDAVDPNFDSNGYIYLAYTVDEIFGAPDEGSDTFNRITRFTMVGDVVDPASRFVLLGNSANDGPLQCSSTHAIGRLFFAPDGSLLVSAGEGARPELVDGGQTFGCESVPGQDLGALRSQTIDSLSGKILRLDPLTGQGVSDKPGPILACSPR
jgi:glucose/arabinose dehydrogenase